MHLLGLNVLSLLTNLNNVFLGTYLVCTLLFVLLKVTADIYFFAINFTYCAVFPPKMCVLIVCFVQLFPNLDKVVFLDDDVVIQRDLSPLWEIDLRGKVNGAVETCKGEDEWVMSKRFRNYFNFSHPLIMKHLDPDECAWAYGMNIFDLRAWRKTNIREKYHSWLKEVTCCLLVFLMFL